MKLPVVAYGHYLLREHCKPVDQFDPSLDRLINNMWDTMLNAHGCGLAAPQVGKSLRLFIIDSRSTFENLELSERESYFAAGDEGITETFINAKLIDRSAATWEDKEGCLSIPGIQQSIGRNWTITIEYHNRQFEKQVKTFSGATARMIQHEYDHIEGILLLDHITPLARKLLQSKLKKISKGQVKVKYPMLFG